MVQIEPEHPVLFALEFGKITEYDLVPQCFQKACFPGASKSVMVWEWVN